MERLKDTATYIGGSGAAIWIRNPNLAPGHQYHFGGDETFREPAFTGILGGERMIEDKRIMRDGETVVQVKTADAGECIEISLCDQPISSNFDERVDRCISRFAVYRHRRCARWDEAALRRMRRIAPHIRRAVKINKLMGINCAATAAMADTLDGLSAGVFFVDENGETLHTNVSGQAMLAEGRLLRSVRGKLVANGFDAIPAFGRPAGAGAGLPARFCVAETRRDADGETYVARVFPIAAGAKGRACGRGVSGIVLHEANLNTTDAAARVARHYRLAGREREVLEAIVDGCGVRETAEKLAIAPSTMKTYLRRLFEKTGTSRQIELIQLCAAFRSPFAG